MSVIRSLEVVRISEVESSKENSAVKSIGGTWFICCKEVVHFLEGRYERFHYIWRLTCTSWSV